MSKTHKHYSAEEKFLILKRYLVEKMALSGLCDEFGLQPSLVYRGQQQLFERAPEAFRRTSGRAGVQEARDTEQVGPGR
jgi:transposase-like protein